MHLRLSQTWEDSDGMFQYWFAASLGEHGTAVEFYAYPDELADFGRQLSDFSGQENNEPLFECGSPKEPSHSWLRLQAYAFDSLGHSAFQISTNCNGARQVRTSSNFSCPLEVASINRLGNMLTRWVLSGVRDFEFDSSEC